VAGREWVVLELSPQGEDEDPEVLASALSRVIRDKTAEVFIPASISIQGDSRVIHKLIDNYVFVRRTMPDAGYLKLEGSKYIASVLTVAKGGGKTSYRELACVKDDDIERMRKQIHVETEQGIEVGDEVQVMSGPYKGINGKIIEEIPENDSVQVYIKLRSKEAIVTLPRSFLKFVSKAVGSEEDVPTFSPFLTKIERIREWIRLARPLLLWDPSGLRQLEESVRVYGNTELNLLRWQAYERSRVLLEPPPLKPLLAKHSEYQRFDRWYNHKALMGVRLYGALNNPPALDTLLSKQSEFQRFDRWYNHRVMSGVRLFNNLSTSLDSTRSKVEAKLLESQWLHDVVQRLDAIARNITNVEALTGRPEMFENVIVDGHNLAYRVYNALGVMKKPLTDAAGNPTGLVFGFLNSATSLKKKFPNATITVVWDGSPQRRINLFEGYKLERRKKRAANGSSGPHTQLEQLRKILPLLGVVQAFNMDEESDDVIACLVRGKLKGQRNVILSTDQDFLQLVTLTDIVLSPKVGNRPETLYDRDKVVEEYGVTPERMVQLRALLGDTSDEIPGIPRVPTKVLTALLNAHGSIDDLLASNLSGTTPAQYAKIRAAENQVRLNLKLMQLVDDLPYEEIPPTPDAKKAEEALSGLSIKAESILTPFFPAQQRGFTKNQEQLNFG